ncbi:degenerin-like protein asic-1 [Hyposmocoma kahamanoa]|uniref:degenerin-like protein asic-1 n=1 Tax=Hyposmocoma kahamanoa TaxID=1477025 RepID=UPI000E6D929F|nr:degenerin-like protein asic-1 [Hyposmocoma kahamanoa]
MTVKAEEDVDEPLRTLKQKCVNCLKGPNLIKTIIILTCTVVVMRQIAVCVLKLTNMPITTYTHFDFNKTIMYPSVTFCKEPAYKYDKLIDYGLYGHPRYTLAWETFNFSAVDLVEMWNDITHEADDLLVTYALDSKEDNIEISSTIGFYHGRCHTLVPKAPSVRASHKSGYSITLKHTQDEIDNIISAHLPGFHVYIHYTREPFTEVEVYNGGLVDYLYINTGETVTAKLTVNEYVKTGKEDGLCTDAEGYSANMCTTQYVWDLVTKEAGCSGPWMVSDKPLCNNYEDMRTLINLYMKNHEDHDLVPDCLTFCRALLYNTYVTDRQKYYFWDSLHSQWSYRTHDAKLQSQLFIHFNSKMVSVYNERYTYDWNIFISDLGGSVGFLLGLSVISILEMVRKIWSLIISPLIRRSRLKEERDCVSVSGSTVTAQLDMNTDTKFLHKWEHEYEKSILKDYI